MRPHQPWTLVVPIVVAFAATAPAQDTSVRIDLRVVMVGADAITIDRGTRDGLQVGDRLALLPRGGGRYGAVVREIGDRNAIVVLDERDVRIEPGTRGEIFLPRTRFAAPAPVAKPDTERPSTAADPQPAPDDPTQPKPRADGWEPGMPLLARVRTQRPAERTPATHGRVWMAGSIVRGATDERGDQYASSFLRTGASLSADNLFGRGETLATDFEFAHRTRFDDDFNTKLIVRRLSYREGGDRFESTRWEFGRFLQNQMPEFGFLDGAEWSRRLESGDRVMASAGFLPNPDDELSTGDDFQIAAAYQWNLDDRGATSFDLGYQKTFHHGDSDRDLLVAKGRWDDGAGWSAFGTAWIDFYTGSRDDEKGSGFDLTQAFLGLQHRDPNGGVVDLVYRRTGFPWTLRREFEPLTPAEIDDDHTDRLALGWRTPMSTDTWWRTELAGWADEREHGGSLEVTRGVRNVLLDGAEFELTAFGSLAAYENLLGLRVALGRSSATGRWDLLYEIANHHLEGRLSNADDLVQHRLRASWATDLGDGWNLAVDTDVTLWDDDLALALGFFVQRRF